jgi:hypothetical protein
MNNQQYEQLVNAISTWASTQDSPERAATWLLIDQGHWLRSHQFVTKCVAEDEGIWFIQWWRVKELLDEDGLLGSSGELAILRFATALASDALGLSSLDQQNRDLAVTALREALDVSPW